MALLTCWLPGKELDRLLLSVLSITLHSCFSSLSISELSSLSNSGNFVYKGLGVMATGPREAAQILIFNPNIPNLYESQLGSDSEPQSSNAQ